MATNDPTTNGDADAVQAEKNARAEHPAQNARNWMLQTHAATLCTTSAKAGLEGFPFGSIVPFCLTPAGLPVVFIASIAAHTANLRAEPRASLFVHDPDAKGDPQKSWRITVMGKMRRLTSDAAEAAKDETVDLVTADELQAIKARYEQRIPFAIDYNSTHDFSFWRMSDVVRIRYIAGFGKICWLSSEEVLPSDQGQFSEDVSGSVDHMNADHSQNLVEICRGHFGFEPKSAVMSDLVKDGFTITAQSPDRTVFVPFEREIEAAEIRPAIISVLKAARDRT